MEQNNKLEEEQSEFEDEKLFYWNSVSEASASRLTDVLCFHKKKKKKGIGYCLCKV